MRNKNDSYVKWEDEIVQELLHKVNTDEIIDPIVQTLSEDDFETVSERVAAEMDSHAYLLWKLKQFKTSLYPHTKTQHIQEI
jgi:hypothetical protein